LIDYSGFNLRIAKWARPAGYDISYYISPQVWASRSGRVEQIKANVDRMLVILPFEEAWYAERGVKATFVGHPLLDVVREAEEAARTQDAEMVEGQGLPLPERQLKPLLFMNKSLHPAAAPPKTSGS